MMGMWLVVKSGSGHEGHRVVKGSSGHEGHGVVRWQWT